MHSRKIYTKLGVFNIREEIKQDSLPTIIFFPAMGINNAFLDNYFLYKEMKQVNIISVDMLGEGESGNPTNLERNFQNISSEIYELVNNIKCSKKILFFHSFTSMYTLNIIEDLIKSDSIGMIFLDPTFPKSIVEDRESINEMI